MKKLITLSILTALAGVAVASAQAPEGTKHEGACGGRGFGMHRFETLDQNHDGKLTRDEMLSGASAHFDQADTNHDGSVTPEERQAAFQKMGEEHFAKQDKNKDGALSGDEIPPHFAGFADKIDANKDGKLTRDELKTAHQKFAQRFEGKFGSDKVKTKSDMLAHVGQRFDRLDTNHDGAVTQDEFAQGRRFYRGHRGHHGAEHEHEG